MKESTLRFVIGALIVVASCVGAGIAWSASVANTHSSDLDQTARQEFLLKHQILTSARAAVAEDLRRVVTYQEQLSAKQILQSQADGLRARQPAVAALLDAQAQGQSALARTTGALFFAAAPSATADGTVTYDREQALNNLLAQYVVYHQLHPAATQAAADRADSKFTRLIAVGVLVVAAIFFLTLAEVGVRGGRRPFAALGTVVLIAGAVLWPLVESSIL